MTAEELLKEIGITKEGSYIDNIYTIELDDSDEFAKMYTLCDNSELVDNDDEFSSLNSDSIMFVYVGDEYEIKVSGDFVSDEYKLEVRKLK